MKKLLLLLLLTAPFAHAQEKMTARAYFNELRDSGEFQPNSYVCFAETAVFAADTSFKVITRVPPTKKSELRFLLVSQYDRGIETGLEVYTSYGPPNTRYAIRGKGENKSVVMEFDIYWTTLRYRNSFSKEGRPVDIEEFGKCEKIPEVKP